MKLNELLRPWINLSTSPSEIKGLHNDSRAIEAGFLFCALKGEHSDGRNFIKEALLAKAAAIVYDPDEGPLPSSPIDAKVPLIALPALKNVLPDIAARFYEGAFKDIHFTGVTGTNGKTSIAFQLAEAHELLGRPSAYIGTLGHGLVSALKPSANTTPDVLSLYQLINGFHKKHIHEVCMEVSSHALDQRRVAGVPFRHAIFTNLTQDHLDYHLNMETYAQAKAHLFALPSLQWAIINEDAAYASAMKAACVPSCEVLTYGVKKKCAVRVLQYETSMYGTKMDIASPWGRHELEIRAPGYFNLYNALAVFTSLMASACPLDAVIPIMKKLNSAPGRMEVLQQNPCVIVDYAHTPDALEQVLLTLTQLKKGRIFLVFGCGGDRDKTKRPIMGQIANQYADLIFLTNDNPRSEDPLQIIAEIKAGMDQANKNSTHKVRILSDREEAIKTAIALAGKEDMVLIAGKGHETYQLIGEERLVFSDRDVVKKCSTTTDLCEE